MAKKATSIILDTCGKRRGPVFRIGRTGSKYFVDEWAEAYGPRAGEFTRDYKKTKRAAERAFADGCEYRGLSGFTLSAAGCRDGTGAFVPVSQCKGRIVGRDAAGKFLSLKGL